MNIQDFYKLLETHDWFFHYSDDFKVNDKGQKELDKIRQIANKEGSLYLELLEAYEGHVFSGTSYGNNRKPKPVIEQFLKEAV